MAYLTTFFTSIFANSVLLDGQGINTVSDFAKIRSKRKFWIFVFYLIAAVAMGFVAFGYSKLTKWLPGVLPEGDNWTWVSPVVEYCQPIILVLAMAILLGLFFLIVHLSPKMREDIKPEQLSVLLNTSIYAIALSIITLTSRSSDFLLILVNICGLPLGYLLSFVLFEPILDRIKASNAPKGFKGIPLMLVTMAGMCLCFASLTF